jgi:hypothetical protein
LDAKTGANLGGRLQATARTSELGTKRLDLLSQSLELVSTYLMEATQPIIVRLQVGGICKSTLIQLLLPHTRAAFVPFESDEGHN